MGAAKRRGTYEQRREKALLEKTFNKAADDSLIAAANTESARESEMLMLAAQRWRKRAALAKSMELPKEK